MKKVVFLFVFLFFLLGLVIWEEITVHEVLNVIKEKASSIETRVYKLQAVDSDEIKNEVKELTSIWEEYEETLCFLVNHKDIEDIGMELSKLRANCNVNQYEDFCASISVILFFTDKYSHIMGISFQNIF